ncbi:hypothetical protein KL929_001714 [Ogataea haglerorum]|uniref:uncharacterized protein n=1 Tax=Ogataea haglerorum TaxID=1937702 RepID=UPI001C8A75B7|nr:uncharacterized protein KL911_000195 [Ogataea haglerorum]KAG7759058.1 hypothetical protein KL911_000195 [Ogataea haglerorum]KAG7798671.1 hypothetical protein KL929_001714 [Ogataea haglerorum]
MDPLEGEEIKGFKIGDKTVDVGQLRHPHSRVVHCLPGKEELAHGGLLRTDKRPKGSENNGDLVQEAINLKKKQKEILEQDEKKQ